MEYYYMIYGDLRYIGMGTWGWVTGVWDVCQRLALDLKAFRGDPVGEAGGEEES